MKKIIIFMVTVLGCTIDAYQDNSLSQRKNEKDTSQFLEANSLADTYDHNEHYQSSLDEYDQHVCDSVMPPQPSEIRAFFERMMGSILIYCFTVKETASQYLQDLKKIVNSWLHSVIK
jgi:hypothetical protein